MQTIIITIAVSFSIALILGILLGIFQRLFYVPQNPKVQAIREVLSGGNCGGCGFAGCDDFAKAVAEGRAPANGCVAGGVATANAIGKILGVEVEAETKVSVFACRGTKDCAKNKGYYTGLQSCTAARIAIGGTKMCNYGCIGFGDCAKACTFNAITIGDDGLPKIDYSLCTGCGKCVKTCPNDLFKVMPVTTKGAVALCSNRTREKTSVIKNCKNGCIKCGKCERNCPENAVRLIDGIPSIDYFKCTSCGTCVEGCPTKVLALAQNIIKS